MSVTYTGVYPTTLTTTTTGGGGQAGQVAPGSTRWNQTTGMMEMYDGYQWTAVSAGKITDITLAEMVENMEDRITLAIEEECPDSVTIQDALKTWQEANERFRVVLAISEKNK